MSKVTSNITNNITTNIAFYAPIKPPNHPIPSGDRLIAQNLIKALEIASYDVTLASSYIAYSKRHSAEVLEKKRAGAIDEANQIIEKFGKLPKSEHPDLWLTYHPYCKAPDWIGPLVSTALDIPYVTLEAARTSQGGPDDPWRPWREQAQIGIKQADAHIVLKPTDFKYLQTLLPNTEKCYDLPPFIDLETINKEVKPVKLPFKNNAPTLVTVGMMRPGKKTENFSQLAEILHGMLDVNWNIVIIGGGPSEAEIRDMFSSIPNQRIYWTGAINREDVLAHMQAADIFVWPGWKEPIGMVYLEAQLNNLPVIAYNDMGVPLVVEHEKTGLLSRPEDYSKFRVNLKTLLTNATLRSTYAKAAKDKVLTVHSLNAAADQLNQILDKIIGQLQQ